MTSLEKTQNSLSASNSLFYFFFSWENKENMRDKEEMWIQKQTESSHFWKGKSYLFGFPLFFFFLFKN